eukprot:c39107_g1_i1 orf=216-431(+)
MELSRRCAVGSTTCPCPRRALSYRFIKSLCLLSLPNSTDVRSGYVGYSMTVGSLNCGGCMCNRVCSVSLLG